MAGLTISTLPMTALASPTGLQTPLLPQVVVGLKQGATGPDVVALQNALLAAGVKVPGGADGFFGPATKSALTAYQSRAGLATSGEVDEASAASLGLTEPVPAASSSSGVLAMGARGDDVKELQRALMDFGVFVPGGADGVFGQATKTAVSNFQRWNGLTVTGDVDAATASRLQLGASPTAPAGAANPNAATDTESPFVGMTIGARGDNVKVLQRALIAAGIAVRGGADGIFGPVTAAAVSAYQQANGFAATGVLLIWVAAGAKKEEKPAAAA